MAKKKYLLVSCILQVIDSHLVFGRFFSMGILFLMKRQSSPVSERVD